MMDGRRGENQFLNWLCTATRHDQRLSVMMVAAHPDDEIIGAGRRLASLSRVTVVHLTDGAPRDMHDASSAGYNRTEEYANARHQEALKALAICGVPDSRLIRLDVPDKEMARNLAFVTQALMCTLHRVQPDIVVTHPFEAGHPDHDAAAFCAHAAVALMRRDCWNAPAALTEFTSYHARGALLETGRFLDNGGPVITVRLSPEEQDLKRAMFACHRTQSRVLAAFPLDHESFRLAPTYDFVRLPAMGAYYDSFDWGLKSAQWPALVRNALQQLQLPEGFDSISSRQAA